MNFRQLLLNLYYLLRWIFWLPLLPIVFYQAVKVKKGLTRFVEAEGPGGIAVPVNDKKTEENQAPLRVLLLGESTIAGVGVKMHTDGITGRLAYYFARAKSSVIEWTVAAKSGIKLSALSHKILPKVKGRFDYVFIGMGANDTFGLTPPWRWRDSLENIILKVNATCKPQKIILMHLPPVADFPALPWLLRQFMGGHTDILRHTSFLVAEAFADFHFINEKFDITRYGRVADFFADGIHPNAMAYDIWSVQIVHYMRKNFLI